MTSHTDQNRQTYSALTQNRHQWPHPVPVSGWSDKVLLVANLYKCIQSESLQQLGSDTWSVQQLLLNPCSPWLLALRHLTAALRMQPHAKCWCRPFTHISTCTAFSGHPGPTVFPVVEANWSWPLQ